MPSFLQAVSGAKSFSQLVGTDCHQLHGTMRKIACNKRGSLRYEDARCSIPEDIGHGPLGNNQAPDLPVP